MNNNQLKSTDRIAIDKRIEGVARLAQPGMGDQFESGRCSQLIVGMPPVISQGRSFVLLQCHYRTAPLLVQALNTTPNLEAAWLWLAACLTEPVEQRYCLAQALIANPESKQARAGLVRFEGFSSVRPAVLGKETIELPADINPVMASQIASSVVAQVPIAQSQTIAAPASHPATKRSPTWAYILVTLPWSIRFPGHAG